MPIVSTQVYWSNLFKRCLHRHKTCLFIRVLRLHKLRFMFTWEAYIVYVCSTYISVCSWCSSNWSRVNLQLECLQSNEILIGVRCCWYVKVRWILYGDSDNYEMFDWQTYVIQLNIPYKVQFTQICLIGSLGWERSYVYVWGERVSEIMQTSVMNASHSKTYAYLSLRNLTWRNLPPSDK